MTQLPMIAPSKGVVGKEPFPGLLDGTPYINLASLGPRPQAWQIKEANCQFCGIFVEGIEILRGQHPGPFAGPQTTKRTPQMFSNFPAVASKKRKSSIQLRGQKNSFSQLHLHKYTGTLVDIQWKCPGPRPFFFALFLWLLWFHFYLFIFKKIPQPT